MSTCLYVWEAHVYSAYGSQRRALDLLGLKLTDDCEPQVSLGP